MNLTLSFLSFSGSAADFHSVERFFEAQAAAGRQIFTATEKDLVNAELDENEKHNEQEVTPVHTGNTQGPPERAFLALIKRIPLNEEHRAYIRLIYDAGDDGTTITEIAEATGHDKGLVKSAFRNFGKRAAHTPEWPQGEGFFMQKWLGNQNRYWLHPAMRHAIEEGRIDL